MRSVNVDPQQIEWAKFLAFIVERQRIWWRKEIEGSPAPWTDDDILASGKFGNIFRKQDKGTRWELGQLAEYKGGTATTRINQVMLIMTYRHNLIPSTTETLMSGLGPVALVTGDRPLISDVIKIYPKLGVEPTDATRRDWAEYCWAHYQDVKRCAGHVHALLRGEASLQHDNRYMPKRMSGHYLHAEIQACLPRLGQFKTYEVVTSLTYLDWAELDENSLPHVGHGAIGMLRRLTGDSESPDEIMPLYLPRLAEQLTRILPLMSNWKMQGGNHYMTCRSVEDALCEYRKYCEVQDGTRDNRPYPDNLRRWE